MITIGRISRSQSPEYAGKAQYTKALDAGYSRGFALASIADSSENRINTAALTHDAWVLLK